MLPSFDKLIKMLTQEKRLGYKNKAVFGGLEKLAPNWATEALQEAEHKQERLLIEEVMQDLRRYPEVAEENRPNYIHKILVKLHRGSSEEAVSGEEDNAAESEQGEPDAVANVENAPPVEESPAAVSSPPAPNPPVVKSETGPALPPSPPPPPSPPMPAAPARPRESKIDYTDAGLESPVTRLPGIKDAMAKKLANLGVFTVKDFLSLYPRRYDDYRSLKTINRLQYGEEVTIIGQVWETRKRDSRQGRSITTSTLSDGTATIEAVWFNQPWLVNKLQPGLQVVISGKVDAYLGRLTFQSPEWEELDTDLVHTGRMVPVYPLTQGLTAKWLRHQVKCTVDYWTLRLPDHLPAESRDRLGLLPLDEAVRQIHFPDDWDKLETARRRLAFDELLMIQLGVLRQKQAWQLQRGLPVNAGPEAMEQLLGALPFELTQAQRRALDEVMADLRREVPMSRLLQGDVGSGKTAVALAAMVLTVLDGGQAAILAPTEILAEQHSQAMGKLLEPIGQALGRPFTIQLLTGSTAAGERRELLD